MNKDQKRLLVSLLEVQIAIRTPTFVNDTSSYNSLSYYFDLLVDSYKKALGNNLIKEYSENE